VTFDVIGLGLTGFGAADWLRENERIHVELSDHRRVMALITCADDGRVSAEMICPYPPGIPIVAPGERLTTEIVDYLEQLAAAGVMVEGAADESLAEFRVVAAAGRPLS
jgi:arginine/lysine/ornithine decarboxylase